jgi:hypothetical protein
MNGFTYRYAVRMPNGLLYMRPVEVADEDGEDATDYSTPSPMRDMQRYYVVLGNGLSRKTKTVLEPVIFDKREDAEKVLDKLREEAIRFGVDNWGATIVAQLCTPFSPGDPGTEFIDQVLAWLEQQGVE